MRIPQENLTKNKKDPSALGCPVIKLAKKGNVNKKIVSKWPVRRWSQRARTV